MSLTRERAHAIVATAIATLLTGCAAPTPAAAPAAAPAAPTQTTAPAWIEARREDVGVYARVPTAARAIDRLERGASVRGLEAKAGDALFGVAFVRGPTTGADEAAARWLSLSGVPASSLAPDTHAGWAGVAADVREPYSRTISRAWAVGGGLVHAWVRGQPNLDAETAARFFRSIVIAPPLRLDAAPLGRFAIAVPSSAIVFDKDHEHVPNRAYYLGGDDQALVAVAAGHADLGPTMFLDGDRAFEEAQKNMGGKLLEAPRAFQLRGAPARELFITTKDGRPARVWLVLGGDTLYVVLFSSTRAAALRSDLADRILQSFRWPR